MDMGHDEQDHVESGAMHAMAHGHMEGSHMHMTSLRAVAPGDRERADQIASSLRQAIEKYRDYRVALAEGFRIFAPNLPQPEYHFTNYWNGFVEGFTFDPARPTSLLYKKTANGGWELIGAMYTAPRTCNARSIERTRPAQRGPVARAHQPVRAQARPSGAGRLDKIRADRIHLDGAGLRSGGRPFLPADLRLDGARIPIRVFSGEDLGAIEPHGG